MKIVNTVHKCNIPIVKIVLISLEIASNMPNCAAFYCTSRLSQDKHLSFHGKEKQGFAQKVVDKHKKKLLGFSSAPNISNLNVFKEI